MVKSSYKQSSPTSLVLAAQVLAQYVSTEDETSMLFFGA